MKETQTLPDANDARPTTQASSDSLHDLRDKLSATVKSTHTRFLVLGLIFLITTINYADRASLSISGVPMSEELGINSVQLGYLFSAFGWSYALGQIPGGWLLDKFGSKKVYGFSIGLWSLVTLAMSLAGTVTTTVLASVVFLFTMRFLLGLVESPAFPANNRVVAAWFPTAERGRSTAIFNSAQYLAVALFSPIMAWIAHSLGWHWVFIILGLAGLPLALLWLIWMKTPAMHPQVNEAELKTIRDGGGLPDMDTAIETNGNAAGVSWKQLRQLLSNRLLWGTYVGQYCITALAYFFTTWFPIYLIQGRGMSILDAGLAVVVPAVCGFSGGIIGGFFSDWLIRRGVPLSVARKTPFMIGMVFAAAIGLSNFMESDWLIITMMALAFFGKGLAAVGWAVISDTAPPEAIGLAGGVFNGLGNLAGIVTPVVIGYTLAATGSFQVALWFVSAHCVLAVIAYGTMGKIRRVVFK